MKNLNKSKLYNQERRWIHMRDLGAISTKLQREGELLKRLNDALLILEVDALGRTSELNISSEDVIKSRKSIIEFAQRLCSVLKQETPSIDLTPIVDHFKSGMKPVEDWIQDLEKLIEHLQNNRIADDDVVVIEDILSLLDDQFTEDLRRLYLR
jgi:DNA invertase Pin-like site-specific DNA recombinase